MRPPAPALTFRPESGYRPTMNDQVTIRTTTTGSTRTTGSTAEALFFLSVIDCRAVRWLMNR